MPAQNLYLSSEKPWKSTYTTEGGSVMYKAESHSHITKIFRATRRVDVNSQADEGAFAHLAEVEYHTFRTSRIRYGGLVGGGGEGEDGKGKAVEEVFRKSGWGFYGRNRIFTGPDGKEYKWVLSSEVCKLVAKDGNKTPIASFHKQKFGFTKKSQRPAFLEIFEAGAEMRDYILITFLYVERLRRERQETTEAASG